MPKRKSKPRPKRQPEFRLRLTPADRKWHATVTKHATRKYPSVGAFLRQAITVLYAIETRPTVSSGSVPPFPGAVPSTSTVWTGPVIQLASPDPLRPFADVLREAAADSLTHPEE